MVWLSRGGKMSLIFELQRVHGTSEWKELVSEVEWNLGAVHDFRTTKIGRASCRERVFNWV